MIKKKAKGKTANRRAAKVKRATKSSTTRKQTNSAEVRNDIAKIVKSGARKITKAVMDQAMTGQLAPAKYLFEVAGVYPPLTDGSQASLEEECLAKTLLDRLDIPDEPVGRDEEDEAGNRGSRAAGREAAGEKESDGEPREGLAPDKAGKAESALV